MWKRYRGKIRSLCVEGDKTAPPTTWWNHLYLALWGWKVVTVFEVSVEEAKLGYRIGYLPFDGKAMIEERINHDRRFRVKNGNEACTFFAIAPDGIEVALTMVARSVKNDATYEHAPLH